MVHLYRGSSTASFGFNNECEFKIWIGQEICFCNAGSYDNEKPFYGLTGTVWYGDSSTLSSQGTWTTGDIV